MSALPRHPDPLREVASRLEGVKWSGPEKFTARCPSHDDRRNSLSVARGDNGGVVLHCFVGCDKGSIVSAMGLQVRDLFADNGHRPAARIERPARRETATADKPAKAKRTYPTFEAAEAVLCGRMAQDGYTATQTYIYPHSLRVMRFDAPGKPKEIRPLYDTGDGWVIGQMPANRPLYTGGAEIVAGGAVIVVEGEKCVDAAVGVGLENVVTTAGGASSPHKSDLSLLSGRDELILIPDNDSPGQKYVEKVIELARELPDPPKSVRVVKLFGLGKGEDIADFIDLKRVMGATHDEIRKAIVEEICRAELVPFDKVELPDDLQGPYVAGVQYALTDLGNGERMADRHGDKWRYCSSLGDLIYVGGKWAVDETFEVVRLAADTVRSIADDAEKAKGKKGAKKLRAWAHKSESQSKINSTIGLGRSRPGISISADSLDKDQWILNLPNCTLDLRTLAPRDHRREDLCTKMGGVSFDATAEAPTFARFVAEILPDPEVRGYVQRLAGLSLTGDTSERVLPIAFGSGSNGKSTLFDAFRHVLGDYAANVEASSLMTRDGNGIPSDIARLRGARFATAVEASEGSAFDVELLKKIAGGSDVLTARFMYKDFFEFRPTFKLWVACNHKPEVRDQTASIWNRLRLIPFETVIPPERIDPALPGKLRAEGSGILNWMLAGLADYLKNGMQTPDAVKAATESYRSESDILGCWLAEECAIDPQAECGAKALYTSYAAWAQAGNHRPMSITKFGRRLGERFQKEERGYGNFYLGVRLLSGGAR